jgi:purine-binding chemotaxis protein CheW
MRAAGPAGPQLSYLAFHKGRERYGIPIDNVVEVLALEHCSPVPLAPRFSPGVVLWRGAILSLVDLARLFEIPETGISDVHVCIVAEAAGRRIGIVANDVDDLVTVPVESIARPPELNENIPPEWLLGVHDENRLLLRMETLLLSARLTDWKQTTVAPPEGQSG